MYIRNYTLGKMWLGKCLKSLVSEDLPISDMVNGLNASTFTIIIDHCESNKNG